jgi:hypothetical protein
MCTGWCCVCVCVCWCVYTPPSCRAGCSHVFTARHGTGGRPVSFTNCAISRSLLLYLLSLSFALFSRMVLALSRSRSRARARARSLSLSLRSSGPVRGGCNDEHRHTHTHTHTRQGPRVVLGTTSTGVVNISVVNNSVVNVYRARAWWLERRAQARVLAPSIQRAGNLTTITGIAPTPSSSSGHKVHIFKSTVFSAFL